MCERNTEQSRLFNKNHYSLINDKAPGAIHLQTPHFVTANSSGMIKQLLNLKWLLQNVVFVSVLHIIIGEQ